jgi:hypothetical protein
MMPFIAIAVVAAVVFMQEGSVASRSNTPSASSGA